MGCEVKKDIEDTMTQEVSSRPKPEFCASESFSHSATRTASATIRRSTEQRQMAAVGFQHILHNLELYGFGSEEAGIVQTVQRELREDEEAVVCSRGRVCR